MLLLVMGVGVVPTSCKGSEAPRQRLPSYCYDESAFGVELERCVRSAKANGGTRGDSRACRSDVHAACGYAEPDGGAR